MMLSGSYAIRQRVTSKLRKLRHSTTCSSSRGLDFLQEAEYSAGGKTMNFSMPPRMQMRSQTHPQSCMMFSRVNIAILNQDKENHSSAVLTLGNCKNSRNSTSNNAWFHDYIGVIDMPFGLRRITSIYSEAYVHSILPLLHTSCLVHMNVE